ncbi:MAG TPA: GTPase HflX [Gemmatimonadaceae bacterium]|nr:GTPase HflX [Gemmatimonadaceae bacterium]
MLVGAPLKRSLDRHRVEEHLEELGRLADTAGADVVGELIQRLDRPDPATYLGKGKIEELRSTIESTTASLVIFDDELTPAQGKNVEDATGRRVMDRAELILDIFATRARSSEAKMQVELAQLQYMLPRLTRMWTHLERFSGGIGARGPGETQLETDRRLIRNRIKVLKERLADVGRSRVTQRESRKGGGQFRVALVGYTNAGKSSILRALSGAADVFVEDRLFATLDPLTREVDLSGNGGGNARILLTDTVGFIRKLPHHLVASFRATLEEVTEADLLLHVIDGSHPQWEEQQRVVEDVLAELGAADKPILDVFNKTDAVAAPERDALVQRVRNLLPGAVFVSATVPGGLEPLRVALAEWTRTQRPLVRVDLPSGDGKLLAELHREAEVVAVRTEGDHVVVDARLDAALAGRLRRAGAQLVQH